MSARNLDRDRHVARRDSFLRRTHRGQIGFGHVAGKDRRLRSEQKKFARDDFLFGRQIGRDRRFPGVEMRQQFLEHGALGFRRFRRRELPFAADRAVFGATRDRPAPARC